MAAVEFALILGVFVMLAVGSFELARAWNVHNVMDHAAREGARFAATEQWESADTTPIEDEVASNLRAAGIQIAGSPGGPGAYIEIEWVEGGATHGSQGDRCWAPNGTDNRVLVCVTFEGYDLNFVFFTLSPDLQATAIARHEH